jgi:mono/diheme cytochrome c family protein
MEQCVRTLLILFLSLLCALANPTLEATRVLGDLSSVRADSKAWVSAERVRVPFYLDVTTSFSIPPARRMVEVDALHDGTYLALRFTWHDATKEAKNSIIGVRGDGFGVAFPQHMARPLPHPKVGSRERPLNLEQLLLVKEHGLPQAFWYDRALLAFHLTSPPLKTGKARTSVAHEGPLFQKNLEETPTVLELTRTEETWQSVVIWPITHEIGIMPVSAWIEEGAREMAGSYLSGWLGVRVSDKSSSKAQEAPFEATLNGNITQGKALAIQHCSRCHWMGDIQFARAFEAPRLDTIGAIGTVEYLKESLKAPHAVVVPSPPEKAWYRVDGVGLPESNMPFFEWLEKEQVENILAYLKSLKEAF